MCFFCPQCRQSVSRVSSCCIVGSCSTWISSYSSSHSFKCWSPFLPVQPTSTCLLCALLGLTSCPSGLKNRRRRLFSSKSVQQRGYDRVTRGLLVLQAGNKPCCPCPGLLSSPWAYIRHTAVPCGYCLGSSSGAAVSAGQTRVADRGGSVHVLWLWLSCAALGAQTDHSLAASSANAELSLAILVCPEHSLPTPGGGLAGGSVSPGSGVPVLTAGSVVWSHGKRQQPGIKSPA